MNQLVIWFELNNIRTDKNQYCFIYLPLWLFIYEFLLLNSIGSFFLECRICSLATRQHKTIFNCSVLCESRTLEDHLKRKNKNRGVESKVPTPKQVFALKNRLYA